MPNKIWNEEVKKEIIDIFQSLIKIKTINSYNNEIEAAKYIKDLLKKDGIESRIIEPAEGRGNIIAKLDGGKEPPILIISHLDVVDVERDEWIHDPFEAIIDEGKIYGRGTLDTKHLTVMGLITMILLKRNNIKLNRDIYFIATADEENGSTYGMKYLTKHYPYLIPKGYVINEGGGFVIEVADKLFRTCACGEKGVCEVKVKVESNNEKGICNVNNNTMVKLSKIIEKATSYESEKIICSISSKFEEIAGDCIYEDETLNNLWEYMIYNTITINEFNITRNIENLNEPIEIFLNFRFVPGVLREDIIAIIEEILEDTDSSWEITQYTEGYESSLNNNFIKTLACKSNEFSKDMAMLPMIALGNTDGRFIRHNVYGYSPLLDDIPFSKVLEKVHSHNECITIDSLIYGSRVIFETVLELSSK